MNDMLAYWRRIRARSRSSPQGQRLNHISGSATDRSASFDGTLLRPRWPLRVALNAAPFFANVSRASRVTS